MPVVGCATPPAIFEQVFDKEGVPATRLTAAQVCDPAVFNADLYDLLVAPTGASYPAAGKEALVAFLKRGGDLFCTGGYAFDALFVQQEEKWVPQEDQLKAARAQAADPAVSLLPNGGFEQGGEGWFPVGYPACTVAAEAGCSGSACGRVENAAPEGGNAWRAVLPVEPGKCYLVGARLKTGAVQGSGYAFMAVYQYAADGSIIHFTDFIQKSAAFDWQRYETQVDVTPNAVRVEFSAGFFRASGTAWVDDVTCAPMPREVRINAHYGKPEDGLVIEPDQLMLFNPDQKYEGATLSCEMPLTGSGYEATAQLGGVAKWYCLDKTYSAQGKDLQRIARGGMVHHFEGIFAGSTWVLFGVDQADLFSMYRNSNIITTAVQRLKRGVFLRDLQTDHAYYRKDEPVNITMRVHNASREPRQERLQCSAVVTHYPKEDVVPLGDTVVELSPGEEHDFQCVWKAPSDKRIYAKLKGQIGEGDSKYDLSHFNSLENPLCVQREYPSSPSLTQLRVENNAYYMMSASDMLPEGCIYGRCLFGTDTYGNMFSSPNQTFAAWGGYGGDLYLMKAYRLDMFENLQFTPENYVYSEKQWRQLDALIQTAQQNELIYMAGLLVGQDVAVSDEELAKQAAMCAAFAQRYKEVPGLIFYLNGDFQLKMKDLPDLRREWNALLRERYGDDAAARTVWSDLTPAEGGELPVTDRIAQSWFDPKARDVAEFKARLMRRWINRLCDAIHGSDKADSGPGLIWPEAPPPPAVNKFHPITAEYYQRTYNGIDLRLTMEAMDASNFGYFDLPKRDLAKLMATIKWNDMRLVDKMVNIGEFGVKTHDAWAPERGGMGYQVQRTPEAYEQLVWWVVHAALAMGVSKIQNWCWADDPDRIFPWGLCYNNPLRPKPVLELYRNLRLAAEQVPIEYRPAETVLVMPDSWRVGAPEDFAHNALINAHECLLAANAPYDTANEAHLDRLLQKPPKWVVMPMAYALPDATLDKLRALAEAGSCVYLSGDPSIGPDGVRRPERLQSLCGVQFESETMHPTGPPVPAVSAVDATVVENPCGLQLYRREVGKGVILWTPSPWETLQGKDVFVDAPGITADPKQNLYLALAPMAGISPAAQVTAESGVWRVTVTPTQDKRLVTVFPRAEVTAPVKVQVKGEGFDLVFEFKKTWPAMVLLNKQNKPVMATGTGALMADGQRIADGSGAWMVTTKRHCHGLPVKDVWTREEIEAGMHDEVTVSASVPGDVFWRDTDGKERTLAVARPYAVAETE